jgi:hypothetical protein
VTRHRRRCLGVVAALALALTGGVAAPATAQQAVLYEIVENMDTMTLLTTNHRLSYWTAQGTAEVGSPFCPAAVVPPGVSSCTITAFGTDDIDLNVLATDYIVGTVWANVVAVANEDNVVDAPEVATFSGQITGELVIIPPGGTGPVVPQLRKKKALLGPALPLIYIVNGKFFPDAVPTVRTSPPSVVPTSGQTATFESTFRLPFNVVKTGRRGTAFTRPEHGRVSYYLRDDGSLQLVHRQNEYAKGFPLLRGEVFFTTP